MLSVLCFTLSFVLEKWNRSRNTAHQQLSDFFNKRISTDHTFDSNTGVALPRSFGTHLIVEQRTPSTHLRTLPETGTRARETTDRPTDRPRTEPEKTTISFHHFCTYRQGIDTHIPNSFTSFYTFSLPLPPSITPPRHTPKTNSDTFTLIC